jgi:hypothetical protein
MKHLTDQIIADAIAQMPETFDSHDLIREVMTRAPRAYADDLAATRGDDPIQDFHAAIGRRLVGFPSIAKTPVVTSMNVRGRETENQGWKKL